MKNGFDTECAEIRKIKKNIRTTVIVGLLYTAKNLCKCLVFENILKSNRQQYLLRKKRNEN